MEFLSQHILPPTGHYLDLLQVLSVLTLMIHLPYIGMVIGGTGSAMWFTLADSDNPNPRYARFAGDLIDLFLGSKTVMLVFGVLPLLVQTLAYIEWFVGVEPKPLKYIPMTIVPVVLGFFFLVLYRRSFAGRSSNIRRHLGLGSIGVVLLLASYFVFFATFVRLQDPEKWFRVKNLGIMLLNWNAIWKFLFFMHASFALTGCAILFFFFKWSKTKLDPVDDEYAGLVRNYGAGMAFAFSLAIPVFYLFYVFTTADVALDNIVYLLSAGLLLLTMIVVFFLFANLRASKTRFGGTAFVLFLGVFLLSSIVDQKTLGNANLEHKTLVVIEAQKLEAEREAEIEALLSEKPAAGRGKEIFTGTCMACHRFDSKLVGPPLASVLPKYKGHIDQLEAFIKSPTKKNPDLPPMPNLGLSDSDIEAVANYVLQQLDERAGGSTE